jgi:hypothetical protein
MESVVSLHRFYTCSRYLCDLCSSSQADARFNKLELALKLMFCIQFAQI